MLINNFYYSLSYIIQFFNKRIILYFCLTNRILNRTKALLKLICYIFFIYYLNQRSLNKFNLKHFPNYLILVMIYLQNVLSHVELHIMDIMEINIFQICKNLLNINQDVQNKKSYYLQLFTFGSVFEVKCGQVIF